MNNERVRGEIVEPICAHRATSGHAARETASNGALQSDARRNEANVAHPAVVDSAAVRAAMRHTGHESGWNEQPHTLTAARAWSSTAAYDLAIVGSGAAAFAAAIKARGQGARVVMIERGTIGGTCVNIGCIPSKTLIRTAEVYHTAADHPFAGIATTAGHVDLGQLVAQKNRLVGSLREEKYADLVAEYGWDLVIGEGDARFLDDETLVIGPHTIRANRFLIATGARPGLPAIPGLAAAEPLTSTEALEVTDLPRSLIVIGAGYVALELGQMFRRLGTEVTLLQRGPRLLAGAEPEVADAVAAMLERDGVEVLTVAHVQQVERNGLVRRVHIRVDGRDRMLVADHILVAAGRMPNTDSLHLAAAGIQTDARGAIVVDESLRTTNPRVFAAGDVTLSPQYVYVAAYQGGLAAENALTGRNTPVDLTALPGIIFTDPQVATVGLTEAQARDNGIDVKTAVLPVTAVPRAQVNYETIGVFKLVADGATNQLLGAHIVAANAGDVIYAAVLAVKHRLTVTELVDDFTPYLTMAEGLKLAALTFDRDVAKLSCCAA